MAKVRERQRKGPHTVITQFRRERAAAAVGAILNGLEVVDCVRYVLPPLPDTLPGGVRPSSPTVEDTITASQVAHLLDNDGVAVIAFWPEGPAGRLSSSQAVIYGIRQAASADICFETMAGGGKLLYNSLDRS